MPWGRPVKLYPNGDLPKITAAVMAGKLDMPGLVFPQKKAHGLFSFEDGSFTH